MRGRPRLSSTTRKAAPSEPELWFGWTIEREGPEDDPTRLSATHIVTGQVIVWKRPTKSSTIGSSITSWREGLRALTR